MAVEADNKIILDGQKISWHKDRVEAWLRGERIAPITVDIGLTKACSYKCEFCCGKFQANTGHVLKRDHIFRFLDDAAEIGIRGISILGDGESTLSPYFYDAVLRGKANGIDMAVGTNGYMLKDDRLDDILPSLTYLRFNISAGTPDRYARIHGVKEEAFYKVIKTIKKAAEIKKNKNLAVTIGLQMVLLPDYGEDVLPLARLGKELGADYLVIKHCSDDELGTIGVQYEKYEKLIGTLKEAEKISTKDYLVKAKWSKILSGGKRSYSKCYAIPFMLQLSGAGIVTPCGFFFHDRYKDKFHMGNIAEKSFKEIWQSDRYWQIIDYLTSDKFNAHSDCGTLCLQHKVNEYLWELKNGNIKLTENAGEPPMHINFI